MARRKINSTLHTKEVEDFMLSWSLRLQTPPRTPVRDRALIFEASTFITMPHSYLSKHLTKPNKNIHYPSLTEYTRLNTFNFYPNQNRLIT